MCRSLWLNHKHSESRRPRCSVCGLFRPSCQHTLENFSRTTELQLFRNQLPSSLSSALASWQRQWNWSILVNTTWPQNSRRKLSRSYIWEMLYWKDALSFLNISKRRTESLQKLRAIFEICGFQSFQPREREQLECFENILKNLRQLIWKALTHQPQWRSQGRRVFVHSKNNITIFILFLVLFGVNYMKMEAKL